MFGNLITRLKEGSRAGRSFRTMFSITYGAVEGAAKILMQHYSFEWQGEGLGEAAAMMGFERVTNRTHAGPSGGVGNSASGGECDDSDAYDCMEDRVPMRDFVPWSGGECGPESFAGSRRRKLIWQSPQMRAAAFLIARNLSVGDADSRRVGISSNGRMLYIDPRTLMYVESRNHGCEVVTLTKAFFCNISLVELSQRLPEYCCRVHRGYLVNAHYVTTIRRSELELASGVVVPIPVSKYVRTRRMLNDIIERYHR
ncbi:LytR/AlgR family response regulator transcription factor [Bifidobacterium eulemuris]|uniref:LytTr DNA-binding domain-containing protein n=1 Tax=Bifidobacterium eulemuris TaxID=1765219 RepID=A0A261G9R6_9BIFI|nr:LytTR family DNA-binding domain-containing protein [Bifidobacterium eulemuris]OZG68159.1 LytTr DNA-binding domain-containing protein [Bifidobacterium eulemuris]